MKILMLAAGRASRFKEVGYTVPKPLIEVKGRPMIRWATDALSFIKKSEYIFMTLAQHEEYNLSKKLQSLYGKKAYIHVIDRVTEGAAATALLVKDLINTDDELIISNADQYFTSAEFVQALSLARKDFIGVIPTFEATHPRWSFAKVNEKGFVTEVAEKVPISNHATVGVYYFKKGKDFVWAAEEMIRKDIRRNNEFYICPTFNELLGRGDKIKAVNADTMWSMGTPEDVSYFEKYFKER